MTERFAGVVIVAAGRGERFGDSGKVLSTAVGRPLLSWSIGAIMTAQSSRELVVVCGEHTRQAIDRLIAPLRERLPVQTCIGGAERPDSVRAGLDCLSSAVEVAVIHDAARPLATPEMFDDVARAAREYGGAIVATPVIDTIKEVDGDRIARTVPRYRLRAAQTPQAFRRELLVEAMTLAARSGERFTDEAGLLEWAGYPVIVREGAPSNMKVTVPEDLVLVDALLRARLADGGAHVPS